MFIILFMFINICILISIDKRYDKDLIKKIEDNTDIENVVCVSEYDDNYIIRDKEFLYLFNSMYEEIYRVDLGLIHDNKKDYEIVYRDNTIVYMDSYIYGGGVVFKYYDIYTYELIDELMVGGS